MRKGRIYLLALLLVFLFVVNILGEQSYLEYVKTTLDIEVKSNELEEEATVNIDDYTATSISISDATVTESDMDNVTIDFTVSLSEPSYETIQVNYITENNTALSESDYIASNGTLTFNPGETSKTVSIVVNSTFSDDVNESFFVNLLSPKNAIISDNQGVGTIIDNNKVGFKIIESNGSTKVSETGTTDTFNVVLDTKPKSNVVLSIDIDDKTEVKVDKKELIFNNHNWNIPQVVTVIGLDDIIDDDDISSNIVISVIDEMSEDKFDPLKDKKISVTTIDNDTEAAGFTITETDGNTEVSETRTVDTFTVVLDAKPNSEVILSITTDDATEVLVEMPNLIFTPHNWNISQTVVVIGVDDNIKDGDITSNIIISVNEKESDENFAILDDQRISVTTIDNETEAGFTITETDGITEVFEIGTIDTFTVVLDAKPNSNVVLSIFSSDETEVLVEMPQLIFTPSNWNTPHFVVVTGVDDTIVDGDISSNIIISVIDDISDKNYHSLSDQEINVTTIDNDMETAGFTITETDGNTVVSETGTIDTFAVVLDSKPINVVFFINVDDETEAIVDKKELFFNSDNWNIPQIVTITGIDDIINDGDMKSSIIISVNKPRSDEAYGLLSDKEISVTTIDDDTEAAGFTVTETDGITEVSEIGTVDTFTVVLDAQPNSEVILSITTDDASEVLVEMPNLIFTPDDWNIPQSVVVIGVDDNINDGDISSNIIISVNDNESDKNFAILDDQKISVTTIDNETEEAGFTVIETDGNTKVSENGTSDKFDVVLDARPNSNVVLFVDIDDETELTVDKEELIFTNDNWDILQVVKVTGVDDTIVDGDISSNIIIGVIETLSDKNYHLLNDQEINVITVDDDTEAGFTVIETDGNTKVSENGTIDNFEVVLDARPNSNVVLSITINDETEAIVDKEELIFTNDNWDIPQIVKVTGVDDTIVDGDISSNIIISVIETLSDKNYHLLSDKEINVTTIDNDMETVGFTITETDGNTVVSETGTIDTFAVVLDSKPTNAVFFINIDDETEAIVDKKELFFNSDNWNIPQIVTVTGIDDIINDGNIKSSIIISVNKPRSDEAYGLLSDKEISVITVDDDLSEININCNGIDIVDGDKTPSLVDYTDFGEVTVIGDTKTRRFIIENTGKYDLILSGNPIVSIGGNNPNDFKVINQPEPIVSINSSTFFSIRFDPNEAGLRTAKISISNNDIDESVYDFVIQGIGIIDNQPPYVIAYNPVNGDIDVTNNRLEITFNEEIFKANGNVEIYSANNNIKVETISLDNISIDGNKAFINLSNELNQGTEYYVKIDEGIFKDKDNNSYAGINDTTTWGFTTKRVISGGGGSKSGKNIEIDARAIVNGEVEIKAYDLTKKINDQLVTTVAVVERDLLKQLKKEDQKSKVTIDVKGQVDIVVARISGETIKKMEEKESIIEIATEKATYILPANKIEIDQLAKQLDEDIALDDIRLEVAIGETTEEMAEIVEETVRKSQFTHVMLPVDYTVTCDNRYKELEITGFNNYVERLIAIPPDVEITKITTAVKVYSDGDTSHVPTQIIEIDEKYYAKVKSVENGTYLVIWNPKQYQDVVGHWAEEICNEIGARMIVSEETDTIFNPNQPVTRLMFTQSLVRALGLGENGTESKFIDIDSNKSYFGIVATSLEYDLVRGYEDKTFRAFNNTTREEAAALIVRAMKVAGLKVDYSEEDLEQELDRFIDKEEIALWARKEVSICAKNGMIIGNNKGEFNPKKSITKAELSVIIKRILVKAGLI